MSAVDVVDRADVSDTGRGARALAGFARVRLRGPITATTAHTVRELIRGALRLGDARVLVDLQAVTTLDVSGIAALLEGRRMVAARAGGSMVLRVNRIVSRALKESGTVSVFRVWSAHET